MGDNIIQIPLRESEPVVILELFSGRSRDANRQVGMMVVAHGFGEASLPVAERAASEVLSLPIHPNMSDTDAAYVTRAIGEFFAAAKKPAGA